MTNIIFITGGQKSGKTTFAQDTALKMCNNPIYLATSRVWDEDHKKRIERHKADRGLEWTNIEEEKYISKHNLTGRVVLIDCITLWMTNFFFDNKQNVEKCLNEAKHELEKIFETDATFIIVSNEISLGGSSPDKMAFHFTDMLGLMNQFIAKKANEVYITVSGIPIKIK